MEAEVSDSKNQLSESQRQVETIGNMTNLGRRNATYSMRYRWRQHKKHKNSVNAHLWKENCNSIRPQCLTWTFQRASPTRTHRCKQYFRLDKQGTTISRGQVLHTEGKIKILQLAPLERQIHCGITSHLLQCREKKEKLPGPSKYTVQSRKQDTMESYRRWTLPICRWRMGHANSAINA